MDGDIDIIVGETMEDMVLENVVEGANALPEIRWDLVVIQTDEELVAGNGGEGQFNVTEEYYGWSMVGGAFVLM